MGERYPSQQPLISYIDLITSRIGKHFMHAYICKSFLMCFDVYVDLTNTHPAMSVALSFLVLTALQYRLFLRVKSEPAQPADSFIPTVHKPDWLQLIKMVKLSELCNSIIYDNVCVSVCVCVCVRRCTRACVCMCVCVCVCVCVCN